MAPVSFQFQASQVMLSASITTKYVSPKVIGVPGTATVVSAQQLPKAGLGGALMNPDKFTPGAPPESVHRLIVAPLSPNAKPKATSIWLTLPPTKAVNCWASSTSPTEEPAPPTVQPKQQL